MKYTRIQRANAEDLITIGEYVKSTDPNTYAKLNLFKTISSIMIQTWAGLKDITQQILAAADVSGADKRYARLMREPLLPGQGGLLPGERYDVI